MSGKLYYVLFIQVQSKGASFQFARPFYCRGFKITSYLTDLAIKVKNTEVLWLSRQFQLDRLYMYIYIYAYSYIHISIHTYAYKHMKYIKHYNHTISSANQIENMWILGLACI
ncbi:unnamed protein product [Meganyctiphanes norvegica]|uniref:Uncharacterized protein n=1 Tax=Meganyctiphanes norvegica TaxID=48144 RepID=A0AAV2QE67_MEGNR